MKTFKSGNENDVEKAMCRADELIAEVTSIKENSKDELRSETDEDKDGDKDLPKTRTGTVKYHCAVLISR